jgi:hypothetical protein
MKKQIHIHGVIILLSLLWLYFDFLFNELGLYLCLLTIGFIESFYAKFTKIYAYDLVSNYKTNAEEIIEIIPERINKSILLVLSQTLKISVVTYVIGAFMIEKSLVDVNIFEVSLENNWLISVSTILFISLFFQFISKSHGILLALIVWFLHPSDH